MIELHNLLNYFVDPVLRAPTLGSMLMCLSASLIGVIVYLRKESLIGEALSHATYPGVILGALFYAEFVSSDPQSPTLSIAILLGAAIFSFFGIWTIHFLTKKLKIKNDSALCFVLSAFFGWGVLFASQMQFTHTLFYKQVQVYLWGQAATMTDIHVIIYSVFSGLVILLILLFYKEIKAITFDRDWAFSLGLPISLIDSLIFCLIILSLITGIRSVGVVLMSAMLIAPAVAARQFTDRLSRMLILSALFGMSSGYFGNVLSFETSEALNISLPTGPMIVVVSSVICLLALLFSPKRGVLIRWWRMLIFRLRSLSENSLKIIWQKKENKPITFDEVLSYQWVSPLLLRGILGYLSYSGWLKNEGNSSWSLTREGALRAQKIIRLHRLWEVYLVDWVGSPAEKVHKSAEEMEHVLTKDLEKELSQLLKNPLVDPHRQPIPPSEEKL